MIRKKKSHVAMDGTVLTSPPPPVALFADADMLTRVAFCGSAVLNFFAKFIVVVLVAVVLPEVVAVAVVFEDRSNILNLLASAAKVTWRISGNTSWAHTRIITFGKTIELFVIEESSNDFESSES